MIHRKEVIIFSKYESIENGDCSYLYYFNPIGFYLPNNDYDYINQVHLRCSMRRLLKDGLEEFLGDYHPNLDPTKFDDIEFEPMMDLFLMSTDEYKKENTVFFFDDAKDACIEGSERFPYLLFVSHFDEQCDSEQHVVFAANSREAALMGLREHNTDNLPDEDLNKILDDMVNDDLALDFGEIKNFEIGSCAFFVNLYPSTMKPMLPYDDSNWAHYDTESYLAAILILMNGQDLFLSAENTEKLPSCPIEEYSDRKIQRIAVEGSEDDWKSIRLCLTLISSNNESKDIVLGLNDLLQWEVRDILTLVYPAFDDGEYADIDQFLGYEIS